MDCPGLVFPSIVDRPLQVVLGSFPIAQVREPFSVVQFLAEKVDLISLLKLHAQKEEEDATNKLSAHDVCEMWALNRGNAFSRQIFLQKKNSSKFKNSGPKFLQNLILWLQSYKFCMRTQ